MVINKIAVWFSCGAASAVMTLYYKLQDFLNSLPDPLKLVIFYSLISFFLGTLYERFAR